LGLLAVLGLFAVCSAGRVGATQWDLRSAPQDETLQLRVWVGSSTCHSYQRVDVEETDERVVVEAIVRSKPARFCTDDLGLKNVDVELARPLGGRTLSGCRPDDPVTAGGEANPGPDCGA
jgi:hypothetical protein